MSVTLNSCSKYPLFVKILWVPNSQLLTFILGVVKRYGEITGKADFVTDLGTGALYDAPAGPDLPNMGTYVPKQKDGKTSFHIYLCQEFLRIGGLDNIYTRIVDKENPLAIDQLLVILEFAVITQIYVREHMDYDSPYQDKKFQILETLEEYVQNDLMMPSIKNFKAEHFKKINQAIVRVRLPKEYNKRMSTVVIEAAKRCLNCDYLSVRVQGCKEIDTRCSSAHRSNSSHLTKDDLAAWLSQNKVIGSIFGANHHSELIQRSEYILKILSRSDIGVSQEEIKLIWNLTLRDKQTKKEIYTILGKVGDLLNTEVQEYIFERFKEYEKLSLNDINFLYSFKKNTDFQLECTWKILNNSASYENDIVDSAFKKLKEMVKVASMEKRLEYINKTTEKLQSGDLSLILIRILSVTFENFNVSTARAQGLGENFEKVKEELFSTFFNVRKFPNHIELPIIL